MFAARVSFHAEIVRLDFIVFFARFQFIFAKADCLLVSPGDRRHLYWRYLVDCIALASHSCAAYRSKCQRGCSVVSDCFFMTTWENIGTVVSVMNGHPRDHAQLSVHCRWPLVTGTDGQAGDAEYNTPCNTTYHHQRYY